MNYLGYRPGDNDTLWGSFFNPQMAPLPGHVVVALEHGPKPTRPCQHSTT